jgi:type IV secretory pathway TrbD component
MKKVFLLGLILVVVLLSVSPALAAPNEVPGGPRSNFVLSGTITSLGFDTVTIWVVGGNYPVHLYRGQPLMVTVTSYTRYLLQQGTYAVPISFDALVTGQPVSVYGTYNNGVWSASRVTVGAQLLCCLP